MEVGFFVLSCILAMTLALGITIISEYENNLRKPLQFVLFTCSVATVSNAVAVVANNELLNLIFYGIYSSASMWYLLSMVYFTNCYNGNCKLPEWFNIGVGVSLIIDTASLMINPFTRHMFTCKRVTIPGGSCYVTVIDPSDVGLAFLGLHMPLMFALLVVIGWLLLSKVFSTVGVYRKRYAFPFVIFLMIVVAVFLGHLFAIPIDFAPILFSILSFTCSYFSFVYLPKSVVGKLIQLSVDDMESGIMCFDKDGHCVHVNERCRQIFKCNDGVEPMERYFEEWRGGRSVDEFREETWRETREAEDGDISRFEVRFKFLLDNKGRYLGSFFLITDMTESFLNLEIERYNATHDYLTDIYNRERFFQETARVLREQPDVKRLILCIDVKDFKSVNDLFGEETGNNVLKRIAGLMRREAHEDTVYGRLEGDHFAMCVREEYFEGRDFEEYMPELKRIVQSSVYKMHVHMGVYRITDPTMNVSVMCDKAFVAIRRIKDNYQQVISYYTDDIGITSQREKVMVGEFDRAISTGEFQMYLQPQIGVGSFNLLGAEALVRWDHPVRGMISPAEFIPVFEKSGVIARLDRYIWELACKQLRAWKEKGREGIHISVNISPKDFYFLDVFETMTALVERYEIDPKYLKLEITETALMEELGKQADLLERLRNYGFQVEIDDFGSGYSSLNTLQDIEVDVLKLDRGFLRKISQESGRSKTIMNSVIGMSKSLGLTVVTEGVETKEQVDYLTQAGCDIFQGFYFDKPMSVRDFEAKYFV